MYTNGNKTNVKAKRVDIEVDEFIFCLLIDFIFLNKNIMCKIDSIYFLI